MHSRGMGQELAPFPRDRFATIRPKPALTDHHESNEGNCGRYCKYKPLWDFKGAGGGLKIRRPLRPWGLAPSRHHKSATYIVLLSCGDLTQSSGDTYGDTLSLNQI